MAIRTDPVTKALNDLAEDAAMIERTGLRQVAQGPSAMETWRLLGGRSFDDKIAFIDRVETDRYAPDLPRGTMLLCVNHECPIHDGDLALFMGDGLGEAALVYAHAGDDGGMLLTDPADSSRAVELDFDDSDNRTYCGIMLIDGAGKPTYRPANRYARAGYELLGAAAPTPEAEGIADDVLARIAG